MAVFHLSNGKKRQKKKKLRKTDMSPILMFMSDFCDHTDGVEMSQFRFSAQL